MARTPKELKLEGTPTQQLMKVEQILKSMQRKMNRVITAVIPPIPFMGFKETISESGLIVRGIIPVKCRILVVWMAVGKYVGGNLKPFKIETFYQNDGRVLTFETRKSVFSQPVNKDIEAGTVIQLSTSVPEEVGEISYGILLHIDKSMLDVQQAMIDALDQAVGEIE